MRNRIVAVPSAVGVAFRGDVLRRSCGVGRNGRWRWRFGLRRYGRLAGWHRFTRIRTQPEGDDNEHCESERPDNPENHRAWGSVHRFAEWWSFRCHRGAVKRPSARITEVLEVLAARRDKRVARVETLRCDRISTPITQLGFRWTVDAFVYDPQVVQRVGQVGVKGPELCFLKRSRLTQFQLGGNVIAAGCGLIRRFDDRSKFVRLGHGVRPASVRMSPAAPL